MTRWFDLMRLPFTLFSLGVEMFASTVREIQRTLNQTMAAPAGSGPSVNEARSGSTGTPQGDSTMANWAKSGQRDYNDDGSRATDGGWNDPQQTGDSDLSGTDLKYVEYSILFTKRDLETPLDREENSLVDYPTTGASFAGLRMGAFMVKFAISGIDMPRRWSDRGYPSEVANPDKVKLSEVPESDHKYITFVYRVKNRLSREAKEYEREQVEVLRNIRDKI
jgi:hypothetical protein